MGDHLKKARLLRGLFRREAGAALGVSGATIKNWEAGETAPRAYLRERIVCFLGYDPGDWTASSAPRGA
ncbi:MAG TPA: helix-turn-helix transcriptional regulator [Thermoanaerobaculia bacterium]|nr:helix-turn-helix transcriptional regulator [Thermoanaerobaculia bacterium]